MTYIDHTPDKETRVELIKTLQSVTEGKVRRQSSGSSDLPRLQAASTPEQC